MDARFITAVSFYGTKDEALMELIDEVQRIVRRSASGKFIPYSLEQIHGTLVSFSPIDDLGNGRLLNEHFHDVTGIAVPIDASKALSILQDHLKSPYKIRLGGHQFNGNPTFLSRGQHPYNRMFSAQGGALVLIGWPVSTIKHGLAEAPLNELRRAMNRAGIMHLYHETTTDIDNDLHMVIGHYDDTPAEAVSVAVNEVRSYLVEHPVEFEMSINQVTIIATDTPTLAPTKFRGHIPADNAAIMSLFDA